MRKSLLSFPLLLLILTARAGQPAIVHEEWTAKPALHTVDPRYNKESAVILLDKRRIEFVDLDKDNIAEYRTVHRIIRVNDDNGIESYNKIYLGYTDSTDIIDMRARAILPNGSVREVNRESMKDLKEDDGRTYKIFAMEGLEKGSEIEFYYTVKRNLDFFGQELLQGSFPIADSRMEILCPERLVFQLKGYNCTIEVADTLLNGKKVFSARLADIPGADKEKYSDYEANLERIEYRLSYNTRGGGEHIRLNTWNLLAKRIHEMYGTFTEKELNRTGDLIEANGWQKLPDDPQKIMAVENYLKKQFTAREEIDNERSGSLEWIIKNKIANRRGMVRLYAAVFQKLGIDYQIVLTCDRTEKQIDRSFENWNNADNFLFYFPSTKKYLAPSLFYLRYPWINPDWAGGEAVYCQSTTIGNYTTAIAVVKQVPLEDAANSFTRIDASLHFNRSMDSLRIDLRDSEAGYLAEGYRAAWIMSDPDTRTKMMKELVRAATNSEKIVSSGVENDNYECYNENKPFVMHADVLSDGLLENAGRNILVKIGAVIGKQEEMYQEKPRQFPIQLSYPHSLERFIDFVVPVGYTVKNAGDLAIRQDFQTMSFVSDYKMEGDTLRVHILETYRNTTYPISDYENFKKVINAAADFNKVTLVLIPKS